MAGTNFYTPISSTCWVALTEEENQYGETQLAMLAKCVGTPPTTANTFEHGCLMTQVDSGTGNGAVWENVGSSASPNWVKVNGSGETSYNVVATNTNGTTNVNVFGSTVPFDLTITGVYLIALDGVAANITVVNSGGTAATIAKGTATSVMVGAASLGSTVVAAGDILQVDSSSAGNAKVFITYTTA